MSNVKKTLVGVAVFLILIVILSMIGGNMTTLNHKIKINAPKDQVFSTLANLELVQNYNPGVVTAKYISDEHNGIGAARECNLGKDGFIRERVTGFDEGKSISMELYGHNWPLEFMHWTTNVVEDGDHTLVSQTLKYKLKFGVIGMLLDKLMMKNKLTNQLDEVFKSMKTYIESDNSR